MNNIFAKLHDIGNDIVNERVENFDFTNNVVVICPTYNRSKFLPILLYQFNYQDYPKHLLRLIILDDSPTSNENIVHEAIDNIDPDMITRVVYYHDEEKKTIGQKRNILNEMAKCYDAEYIVCFDDDDYYPPNRVSFGVYKLITTKMVIGGSSALLTYFPLLNKTYMIGPFISQSRRGHASNGTLVYHVSYLDTNSYNDADTKAEEVKFLNNFQNPLVQLPYNNVMICIAHGKNTINKNGLIKNAKELNVHIADMIKDEFLLNFFTGLTNQPLKEINK